MKKEVVDKSTFLKSIKSDVERDVMRGFIKAKEIEKANNKQRAELLSEYTDRLMKSEQVVFEDGDTMTYGEKLVVRAGVNLLTKDNLSFKDLNDVQKVIDNETEKNTGTTIEINFPQNMGK